MPIDYSAAHINSYWSIPKPQWDDWTRKARCRLWQAVALACDVDPKVYEPHGLVANPPADALIAPVPGNVQTLVALAQIAVGSGLLKVSQIDASNLMQCEVDLSAFATWLRTLGHKTPGDFPWTPNELSTGAFQWPWGSYQTKDLHVLAQAADKFWKNFDPTDHSTAPTNEMVIVWLEGKGVSRRKAEVIASLLRADDLPTGPRKEG